MSHSLARTIHPGRARRLLLGIALLLALVAPSASFEWASAETDGARPAADQQPALRTDAGSGIGAGTYRITLLTGDVVALHVTADGRQAAEVVEPVDSRRPPQIYEADGQVHVVPAETIPYVASGALDENLFNVTLLARDGFDDASTDELPLLIEASDRARTTAMPLAPDGTDEVRELDSVNTVAVAADKADVRAVWEEIRGADPAALSSTDARLAGDRTVWLNGKVETTLDDSVGQIGAPEAWARGYDGDGTTVAVLDTGYDAGHPDLAGRVVDARSFVDADDPANAVDGNGHGTHVAATVGGSGAASHGDRKGVAPAADLLVGKVLDDNGEGFTDQIIAGMEWAADAGADVVNMSLGTTWASDGTDPLSQAVNDLTRSSDTLFVVAAGNTGPGEQTVGSPGAADLALTVGAVTKDDEPAAFSARGPRIGDGAIKPEITAPGVDIVAARAAGTSLGNLLDQYYTSLNGTSMATPHVAGAAAILAQQHPDWTAAQVKARLVSTSRPLRDQPVVFQGGGRLDVAAAVDRDVSVDKGTLYLGRLASTAGPVTRTLTYRNISDRPVGLWLSADVTSTGSNDRQRPDLRLDRRFLLVPAHGTAKVDARLRPRSTEPGGYAGTVSARQLGRGLPTVHTTVAFGVDGPLRTVTVDAVDRSGQPATGPVDLWSAETGELTRAFLDDGATSFEVPDGLYALVGTLEEATRNTVVGDPELRVTRDRTLHFDARDARRMRVTTPRDADLNTSVVLWERSVGRRSVSMLAVDGVGATEVYTLGSPSVRTGSFTLATQWQLAQPLLTARLVGPDGFRLPSPQLASRGFGGFCQCPAQTYEGEGRLPLVDAGSGTPEELAAVGADGAVALVRSGESDDLRAQAEAADAAGAELLLAYRPSTGPWQAEVTNAPLPIYTIGHRTGQALLDATANDAGARLDLEGVADSTYSYDLGYTEDRRIPSGASYDARPSRLATVTSDYRLNSERMIRAESWIPYFDDVGVGNWMSMGRNGPVVRTEYVNSDGVEWQRFAQPHMFAGYYWTSTNPTDYRAGRRYHQLWWGPLVHPAVPPMPDGAGSAAVLSKSYRPVTRYRDAIRVNLPHYSFGGSLTSTIYEQFGDRSELVLERDGEVIGTSTWPDAQFTVPADRGWYDLTLDIVNGDDNWSDTSVSSSTTWRFTSARTKESGTPVPLVQVDYGLDTDAYNQVPSDATYPLYLDPGYQPEASGPGRFTADVEVSFDDGATWQATSVKRVGDRLRAQIPAAAGPGYASVRVVVTDAAGNELTQQIDRAWKIAAS